MQYTDNGDIVVTSIDNIIADIFNFLKDNTQLQGDFNDFKNTNLFAIVQILANYIYIQKNSVVLDLTQKFLEINTSYQSSINNAISNNWYEKFLQQDILMQMEIKNNQLFLYLKDLNVLDNEIANNEKISNFIKQIVQFPPISALSGSINFNNVAWTNAIDKKIELSITIMLVNKVLKDTDVQDIIFNNFNNNYKFGNLVSQKLLLGDIDYITVDIKAKEKGNLAGFNNLSSLVNDLSSNYVIENSNDIKVSILK